MPGARKCEANNSRGESCGQAPLVGGEFCFWHDPENVEEAEQARKAGRQRQRRERVIGAAYSFDGIKETGSIQRLVEVAISDTLELSNSVARNRTLAYLAQTATRLLEALDQESRIEALEEALGWREEGGKRR